MHADPTWSAARSGGEDPGLQLLRRALQGWRDSLIDMGGRNKLLNFKHSRAATLEIESPHASDVLVGLGRGWDFASVDDEGSEDIQPGQVNERERDRRRRRPDGLVTQKATQAGLDSALNRLRQQSRQAYNDYGLWLLWLGVGMLDWKDGDAQEGTSAAPLLLVPVELDRDRQGRTRLRAAEDQEPMHNPALAVRLSRTGVDWTPVTQADADDLPSVLAAARRIAAEQSGWAVSERIVLGLFQSHKEAMYQDLQQNEDMILGHSLIRAVALGPDSGLSDELIGFEPPALDRIDEVQLPERTPLVLDADASQRQCIAAALDGRSFVMSGPPGTGKSQTITNVIAALMHAGRSVLFVSEKAAALDVVRNRLRGVGLGDFVLALHSGNTTKKAVATELGRVLTTQVNATGAAAHELDRARQLREELSAYAAAMNETRDPLERTLHDVLGRLVLLDQADTPQLTLRSGSSERIRSLSAGALHELVTAARAVSRAWRPAAEGDAFAWRGLVAVAPLSVLAEAADTAVGLQTAAERRPFAAARSQPCTVHEVGEFVRALRAGLSAGVPSTSDELPEDPSTQLAQLADSLGVPKPGTPEEAFSLWELADLTQADHRPPAAWFDTAVLSRAQAAADELRRAVDAETEARKAAEHIFGEQVLGATDLPELVERFATRHKGLMARFGTQFRTDRDRATALTRNSQWDKAYASRLPQALVWQQAAAETARLIAEHAVLLGPYTPRGRDGFKPLDGALTVAHRIGALTHGAARRDLLVAKLSDGVTADPLIALQASTGRTALADWCDIAERRAEQWERDADRVLGLFDEVHRLRLYPTVRGTLDQARSALAVLQADPLGPEEWRAYSDGLDVLNRYGAGELVQRCAERGIAPETLPAIVERALLQAWTDIVYVADPRLHVTRSADLDSRLADFREADRRLVAAAHGTVIEACNGRRPRSFGAGAAAVITRQAELKTRHMPVRELLGRTREVVQSVKPCFMMSPLTVSQFLPADYRFDVIIFDEASQVRPSDAVNSIYRGRALIVAGDEKQLPPTSFFDASVGDEPDEYDEDLPDTFESLLDACKAGAMRVLPLRWHYRSRHEDLITFSNRSFYKNSMVTFPGARDNGNDVGVAFFKADGRYDRGGRKDNIVEAELVARRVIHHFDTRVGSSLGVVALSQAQASAIELAVQQARAARPDLDRWFTEDRLDGFFVKNLESVQGDERDVMIMSIGYGPDEHDRLGLNFGPINREGGWRRLNVAVTRARYRMEVVSSFPGGRLSESQNESVQHLKRYLEYAENGPAVLAHNVVQDAEAATDSPFEESVLNVLQGWGHDVQPQVGVAGYRIDLGLRHPAAPGSYALGIECDGAMYHSSRVARDRDRLRQQVLEGLGWKIYRIWGTDWYRDRPAAEERLRQAVEQAVAQEPPGDFRRERTAGDSGPSALSDPELSDTAEVRGIPAPRSVVEPERVPVVADSSLRMWSTDYRTAEVYVSSAAELHTPEARRAIRRILMQIIEVEGPLHEDVLVQRTREAWGVAKAGSRIRDNLRHVLTELVREGGVAREDDFLRVAGRNFAKARRPAPGCVRKVAHIPTVERQLVLVELAAECPGMSDEELFKQTCDFFGWKRLGQDIRTALESDLNSLFGQGRLSGTRQRITSGAG